MKKTYLYIIAFSVLSLQGFAQSQRLVLYEEFTQASCPPCAAANPAFNAFLNANTTESTSIKYQTSWPGVDPMNAQNPSEVANRVGFYNVTGVPDAIMDGAELGSPGNATGSLLYSEYNTPSPFTITQNFVLSAASDSILTHVVIRKTGTTTGTLYARVVVIEKLIHFTSPPGGNGETNFEHVMKKMLPTANGTVVPSSMGIGDSMVLNLKWKLVNVYNVSELALVSFVQTQGGDKSVLQAGYSPFPSATGVSEIPTVSDFNIYPNPSNGNLTISLNSAKEQKMNIQVLDQMGKVVFAVNDRDVISGSTQTNLDLSSLSSGIYMLRLENKEGSVNRKIILTNQ